MNIVLTAFAPYLYFALVALVKAHYFYDENPSTGFVSLNNGVHSHSLGFPGKQRRFMGVPSNPIYQRTPYDRTANYKMPTVKPTLNKNTNGSPTNQKVTDTPKKVQNNEKGSFVQDSRHPPKAFREKTSSKQNYRAVPNARSQEYKTQTKQLEHSFNGNKANGYDNKGMQVNVNKSQIYAEPQKVKLNNYRHLTALSIQRREDNYKRMPNSMLVDKSLQNAALLKDRNAQTMLRVLDDITNKVTDRRIKNNEYRKRDTVSSYDSRSNTKWNAHSDNMKKYIGKDINIANMNLAQDTARVGSPEEEVEESNAPYALFYRMSPETLDSQEGFYLLKSMQDDGGLFSIKKKRLSINHDNAVEPKKIKNTNNYNSVKLGKKVKNFANFRSTNNI